MINARGETVQIRECPWIGTVLQAGACQTPRPITGLDWFSVHGGRDGHVEVLECRHMVLDQVRGVEVALIELGAANHHGSHEKANARSAKDQSDNWTAGMGRAQWNGRGMDGGHTYRLSLDVICGICCLITSSM